MPNNREKREKRTVSAERRLKEHKTGFDLTALTIPEGVNKFTPKKEGTYRLEVLPFEAGDGNPYAKKGQLHFERTYFTHRGIGANQDSYVCLAKTSGKPCPVCEHRAKLAKDPKSDEQLIKDLSPKERQLWLIYDHGAPERGVQIWDVSFHNFGKHLDKKINNADEEDKEQYQKFADPEEGSTLKVGASEESMGGTKFLSFTDIEFKARKDALDPELVNHGVCLDDVVKETAYDKLKKIFLQTGEEDDDGEDEDKPAPKKKSKGDDDEDDDPPAPKKKAAPPPDDDDEDDDDPPPAKATKKAAPPDDGVAVGDTVSFVYKDKKRTGTVSKINEKTEIASVDVEGRELPYAVSLDELKMVKKGGGAGDDQDDDDPPPPKAKVKTPPPDDDDDDDKPAPKAKKAGRDEPFDDDDDDDEDDAPKAKVKNRGK